MKISIVFIFVIANIFFLSSVEGKFTTGTINTTDSFFYLGKFTYSNKGAGNFTIETSEMYPVFDAENGYVTVNIYNNDPSQRYYWPDIWNNPELSCQEKVDLQYPTSFMDTGAVLNNDKIVIEIIDANVWTWYFVVSDCTLNGSSPLSMKISMEWLNHGNGWYKEFSVEDQDLLTIYLVFFILWLVLFPAFIFCLAHFFLKHSYQLDSNLKLFCLVLVLDFLSLFMYLMHYTAYAIDGVGVPGLMVSADVLSSLGTMCFFVVLVQVVSLKKSVLDQPTWVWVLLSTLLLTYLGFFFWQEITPGLDPQVLSYRWATIPGIIMMVIQLVIWGLFVFLGGMKMKEGERKVFVMIFGVYFTAWFWILPFSAACAQMIPYYDRWKAVLGVLLSFNLFAYAGFSFFVFPNRYSNVINPIAFAESKYNERLLQSNRLFDEDTSSPYGSL